MGDPVLHHQGHAFRHAIGKGGAPVRIIGFRHLIRAAAGVNKQVPADVLGNFEDRSKFFRIGEGNEAVDR